MHITLEITRISRFGFNVYLAIGQRDFWFGPMAC
jgi:hypothetical protein